MGFRVTIFSQQLSPSGSRVRCLQSPCRVLGIVYCAALDHAVSDAGAWQGTCPRSGLSFMCCLSCGGSSILWSHKCSIHVGSRTRDPEHPSLKSPEKKLAPSFKEREGLLHTKCLYQECKQVREREPFHAFAFKSTPPQIPCAQEASGSVQLFLQCISVHHFCQLLGVVDPLSAATFNQGKSSPATHRHTGICPSRVGHPSGPCSSQPSTI